MVNLSWEKNIHITISYILIVNYIICFSNKSFSIGSCYLKIKIYYDWKSNCSVANGLINRFIFFVRLCLVRRHDSILVISLSLFLNYPCPQKQKSELNTISLTDVHKSIFCKFVSTIYILMARSVN